MREAMIAATTGVVVFASASAGGAASAASGALSPLLYPFPHQRVTLIADETGVGDADGDGRLDIFFVKSQEIYVSVRDNHGGFLPPVHIAGVGDGTAGPVILGDFNGDGRIEPAIHEYDNDRVGVYLSVPDGSYSGPFYSPSLTGPVSLAAADLNNDGFSDLVCGHASTGLIGVHISNGDGTFQPTRYLNSATLQIPFVFDVDGDGWNDIVTVTKVWSGNPPSTLSFHRSLGNGLFAARTTVPLSGYTPEVHFLDADSDGDTDLLIQSMRVLLNDGLSGFAPPIALINASPSATPTTPYAVGDVDGDGDADIVGRDGSEHRVYRNDGAGVFTLLGVIPSVANQVTLALEDMDQDGNLDLVTQAGIILGRGDGTFRTRRNGPNQRLATGDLDGDGVPDLVAFEAYAGKLWFGVYENPGDGAFGLAATSGAILDVCGTSCGLKEQWVEVCDVDGDGDLDALCSYTVSSPASNGLLVLFNDGFGVLGNPSFQVQGAPLTEFHARDFDGDDDVDLLAIGGTGTGVRLLSNDGAGNFTLAGTATTSLSPTTLAVGDIDSDGDIDALTGGLVNDSPLIVLTNDGSGQFVVTEIALGWSDPGNEATWIALGDLNGDGAPDAAVASYLALRPMIVVLNDGAGGFIAPGAEIAGGGGQRIAMTDVDRDGDLDIVSPSRVVRNEGSGVLELAGWHPADGSRFQVADVNGDLYPDLVTFDANTTGSVILNESGLNAPPTACPADVDGSGTVDASDFVIIASNFGAAVPAGTLGDCNGDGVVNAADFVILAAAFGSACP